MKLVIKESGEITIETSPGEAPIENVSLNRNHEYDSILSVSITYGKLPEKSTPSIPRPMTMEFTWRPKRWLTDTNESRYPAERISTIKFVREWLGIGLGEAKAIVDSSQPNYEGAVPPTMRVVWNHYTPEAFTEFQEKAKMVDVAIFIASQQ